MDTDTNTNLFIGGSLLAIFKIKFALIILKLNSIQTLILNEIFHRILPAMCQVKLKQISIRSDIRLNYLNTIKVFGCTTL